jgi:hypothetical protein
MTPGLLVLLFASSLVPVPQSNSLGAPGCGSADVQFDVKTSNQHSVPAPDASKALIVFLQDDAKFESRPRPTVRFGVDGSWVGATHSNSFFYVSVDPGEHHLCANWQSRVVLLVPTRPTAAAHFIAEAGNVYYFTARDINITNHGTTGSVPEVRFEPMDSDEGQVLTSSFSFSESHPKK